MVIEVNKEEFDLLKGLVEARVHELGPKSTTRTHGTFATRWSECVKSSRDCWNG